MQCWRCTSHNVALQVHTTLPGALNAFSLLGITTSLLTFKFSSLNLIIRGQEKLGKMGVGGGGLEGKVQPTLKPGPHNTPWGT